MPTKRVRRAHARHTPDDELQRTHLVLGDCLLAGFDGGCLCALRRPDGREDEQAIAEACKRLGIPEEDECQPNDND